jgi:hypothetical protein
MTQLINVALDFETFYDTDYSLSKLTTPEYVLDGRFEPIGMALSVNGSPATWFSGDLSYLSKVLSKIPWQQTRLIAHNAIFDGSILEWVFGYKPAQFFCTMMGSRPYVAPYTGSMSLAKVCDFLGVGQKGSEVHNYSGYRRSDFTPDDLASYGRYCANDTWLCWKVYEYLARTMPADEQDLVDLTIKKFVRPKLVLDTHVIRERGQDLENKRQDILAKCALLNCTEAQLRSRVQFTKQLQSYGVVVPTKNSQRTGKPTAAFAKDDEGMIKLLTHDDPRVRTLAEAKIFTSSTMEAKRLARFQTLYDLDILGGRKLPVPLLYYGAGPGRFSGFDRINLQNLSRVKRDKLTKELKAGHLRMALRAPRGYKIVAADLSNIEARLVATVSGCAHLVRAFAEGRDSYSEFATRIYGRLITKANEVERFVGKTCILGLGYGMGWEKFYKQMQIARVKMDPTLATRIVWLYRDYYPQIPEAWRSLSHYATHMIPKSGMYCWGPVTFMHERIVLPNSMPIIYPGIRNTSEGLIHEQILGKGTAKSFRRVWGGLLMENICQALARIIITTAELKLARAGLQSVLQVHDELVYVVPEIMADKVAKVVAKVMTTQVPWLPALPVACEVGIGDCYGNAK